MSITINELKILGALAYDELYGLEIIEAVKKNHKNTLHLGGLYQVLTRMERKGLIDSRWSEETSERGGNKRKYFKITGVGMQVLREHQMGFNKQWSLI